MQEQGSPEFTLAVRKLGPVAFVGLSLIERGKTLPALYAISLQLFS
jgi:hypothetical protein